MSKPGDVTRLDMTRCAACSGLLRRGQDISLENVRDHEATLRFSCPECGATYTAVYVATRIKHEN